MSKIEIIQGLSPTKILGRGRPKGGGCNQLLLEQVKPGDTSSCIFGVSEKKMRSIKSSAQAYGIKLKIRALENGKYAIWRTHD